MVGDALAVELGVVELHAKAVGSGKADGLQRSGLGAPGLDHRWHSPGRIQRVRPKHRRAQLKCRGGDKLRLSQSKTSGSSRQNSAKGGQGGQLVGEHLPHSTSMATRSGRSVSAA